jgi:hypothetical protein
VLYARDLAPDAAALPAWSAVWRLEGADA